VASGAHFLSDIVVAALLGWLAGAVLWRWHERPPAPA
jgi:membrane-associated phospholipid phosphatase